MHIVHISTSDSAGGAARAAHRVHTGLRRLGHHSEMIVRDRYTRDEDVKRFVRRKDLVARVRRKIRGRKIEADFAPYQDHLPPRYELFSDDRTADGSDLALQVPPCDIVNLHWVAGLLDHESFFEHFASVRTQTPLVWRLADMGALTGGCHYDQGCGKFTARCGACPELGSTQDDDLSRRVWERKSSALGKLAPERLHLVATSRWIGAEAGRSSLLGRFPVTIIPNGMDVDTFKPRDKGFSRDMLGIPQDGPVVLFLAESVKVRRKGFAEMAEAVQGITGIGNLTLVSVGSGKPELRGDFRHVHIDRIFDDRVLSIAYSAADVFAIPSLQESFGQTVIESMACGTPVIGFASGGIPDMVRPGVSGWLAPTGDTTGLRQAIVAALSDPAALRAMGETCRRIAVDEYALDVQARQYAALYESLLPRAGRDAP